MNQKLFNKYISNACTPSNVDNFLKWINEHSGADNSFFLFQDYWNRCDTMEDFHNNNEKEQLLNKIHHQINLKSKNTPLRSRRSILISIISKAAAVLLIPLLTLWIYTSFFQPDAFHVINSGQETVLNEVISPIGSRIKMELSDGTMVWLNHGSTLIYPQHFSENSRNVTLEGEGYFKVAHNPHKPFIIEKGELKVIVTGTEFNVKGYDDDKNVEVTLQTGKVFLEHKNDSYELNPGQHLSYNKENKDINIQYINTEKYISWKDGKLIFEDDSFEVLADRLSRWYNVEFEIIDPKIRELTYNATFIDEPLYQILEMLEIVTPIKCKVLDRNKLPDGTYSKKKIQVSIRNEI